MFKWLEKVRKKGYSNSNKRRKIRGVIFPRTHLSAISWL